MNYRLTVGWSLLFVLAVGVALLPAAPAQAATTTFSQKILPLNCVFQEVNDGTGTLIYLTPQECGVILTPPPTASGDQPTIPQTSSNPIYAQTDSPRTDAVPRQLGLSPLTTIGQQQPPARDVVRGGTAPRAPAWRAWSLVAGGIILIGGGAWWLAYSRAARLEIRRFKR